MTPRHLIPIALLLLVAGCGKNPNAVLDGSVLMDKHGNQYYVDAYRYSECLYQLKLLPMRAAPTIVTVTNECTRQHWPEPGQAVHEPCNNVSCQKCWPRNKWLGDGKIVTNDAGGVEK